tara:strand:+ start:455 stop:760 length:306 start_codon:yes stop_codon:yes gene_type:complete
MKTFKLAALAAPLLCLSFNTFAFADDDVVESSLKSVITKPLNINHATVEQLMALKGIGKKKAQAIVSYREEYGAFITVSDLVNVKGIGEKILDDNASLLSI